MDRYEARINLLGTTQRERTLNRLKNTLSTKLPDSLSYKPVRLNGIATQLIINSGTKPYYKEFQSLPNERVEMGDYIEWSGRTWLVYEADSDDEIYVDGRLYECNYLLRWQDERGEIVDKWAYIQNASAYNNGEQKDENITLATNQFMVWTPLDKDTVKLRNGKRMFIDNYEVDSSCYELTRPDTVSMKFGRKGCTYYIFTQTETNPKTDRLVRLEDGNEVWIADYKDNHHKHHPLPPSPNETANLLGRIKGDKKLKVGFTQTYPRTYIVEFVDNRDQIVDWGKVSFSWKVESDFEVHQTVNGNEIELCVTDENCIGGSFLLSVIYNNAVLTEKRISVIEGF